MCSALPIGGVGVDAHSDRERLPAGTTGSDTVAVRSKVRGESMSVSARLVGCGSGRRGGDSGSPLAWHPKPSPPSRSDDPHQD
jgi:ribosomal protein L2